MVKINSIEDILYKEGDIIPPPPRTYTEEEEAQNILDEKLMADMAGWEYERSHRYEDYDDLGDMLADGIDIDDIPESYYTKWNKQKTVAKSLNREDLKMPREEDIEYIPF